MVEFLRKFESRVIIESLHSGGNSILITKSINLIKF